MLIQNLLVGLIAGWATYTLVSVFRKTTEDIKRCHNCGCNRGDGHRSSPGEECLGI